MGETDGLGRRRLLRGLGTSGLAAAGGLAFATAPAEAASTAPQGFLGVSAQSYGATGDGSTDDWAAIQRAMDEVGPGGIVYLPLGVYRISQPLVVPPGVTLQGTHGNHIDEGDTAWTQTGSRIKPLATFTGDACIKIVDQPTGAALDAAKTWTAANYASQSCEQRLFHLTLNGSGLTGTIEGIKFVGRAHGVIIRDVAIYGFPAHAITTTYQSYVDGGPQAAYSCRFERIAAKACGGITYSFNNTTDSVFTDLEAIQGGSEGFFVSGCGNSVFIGCRSEWSKLHGFDVRGGHGIVEFLGCSTDANFGDGFHIDANSTAAGLIILNGLRLNRDGRNGGNGGGGYAGLRINGAKTSVVVTAIGVQVGLGDGTQTGSYSPAYGVSIDAAACVAIDSGLVQGVTMAYRDGGTSTVLKKGPTLIEVTGTAG